MAQQSIYDFIRSHRNIEPELWERKTLSINEAAAYSGVGSKKLRELSLMKGCKFAVRACGKTFVLRKELDQFLDAQFRI